MNYYKPTSFVEKARKIFQLYWLYFRSKIGLHRTSRGVRNFAVIMVVPQLDRRGGYELQALQLSSSLANGGNFVTVLSDQIGKFPAREFRNGFLIYRIPFDGKPTKMRLMFSILIFLIRHRHSQSLVHIHGVSGFSLYAAGIAKYLGRPLLLKPATKDDLVGIFSKRDFKHQLYQKWINKIDRFIAVSEELKEEILSCGIPEARVSRVPNFVNCSKYVACSPAGREMLRSELSVAGDQLAFLFIGRLEARKGVEFLLRAWKKKTLGVLWIVGSGPEEPNLKETVEDLKVQNVFFHKATTDPLKFYQAADIFVFPSVKEGSPNVLLEAMSCGLPCIATRIGGIVDIIQNDEEGVLVESASVDELAEAMALIAAEPERRSRLGAEAAKAVRNRNDIKQITPVYLDLYAELMQ